MAVGGGEHDQALPCEAPRTWATLLPHHSLHPLDRPKPSLKPRPDSHVPEIGSASEVRDTGSHVTTGGGVGRGETWSSEWGRLRNVRA